MADNKFMMVKMNSGRSIKDGWGNGREQFNIDEKAIVGGKYYGVILNTGEPHRLSLENIDNEANKHTEVVHGITLVYIEEIEGAKGTFERKKWISTIAI